MKKIITQETFNETFRENVTELDMNSEEALAETIQQFQAQGVDLSNIVKTVEMARGLDPIKQIVDNLKKIHDAGTESEMCSEILYNLTQSRKLCSSNLAYKMLAGKNGLYNTLLRLLNRSKGNETLVVSCLETLTDVMDGYPDLLDDDGVKEIVYFLENEVSVPVIKLTLRWASVCCIKHESNRQKFFSNNIVTLLKKFITPDVDTMLLKGACGLIWAMTLDDDIRALVPNAHNHACAFAAEYLEPLVQILNVVKDENILSEVVNTLSSIMVRNEFCEVVSRNDGIKFIMAMLNEYRYNLVLARRILKLLTNLAGNDNVKSDIMDNNAAEKITSLLNEYITDSTMVKSIALLISKLTLRMEKYGLAFIKLGVVELITQAMKVHLCNVELLRNCCWALRNIAVHNKHLKEYFIQMGVEEVVNHIGIKFEEISQDCNAVLIALDCPVKLTEQWVGKTGDKLAENK
ncbi:armadillo repeat-containing protein 6 homolog [Cimex lectularius]|uniref:Uncharacterized protein n=1 Tax=Cimex lectularius TaxID=79782 RepID=A0A8I6RKW7_CIMLE|nr:armadillo repeat-containing protein 6 homolog [Cimex lectularius]